MKDNSLRHKVAGAKAIRNNNTKHLFKVTILHIKMNIIIQTCFAYIYKIKIIILMWTMTPLFT